jgi:hypothetical protein
MHATGGHGFATRLLASILRRSMPPNGRRVAWHPCSRFETYESRPLMLRGKALAGDSGSVRAFDARRPQTSGSKCVIGSNDAGMIAVA